MSFFNTTLLSLYLMPLTEVRTIRKFCWNGTLILAIRLFVVKLFSMDCWPGFLTLSSALVLIRSEPWLQPPENSSSLELIELQIGCRFLLRRVIGSARAWLVSDLLSASPVSGLLSGPGFEMFSCNHHKSDFFCLLCLDVGMKVCIGKVDLIWSRFKM